MDKAKVRIEFINPFISAVTSAFTTMVFTECKRTGLYVKKEKQTLMSGDVTVVMNIFGALGGTVALTFPRKVSISLVSSMLMDEDIDDFNDDVVDGVGEIGNLVIGSAKSQIAQTYGREASVSIPTILTGANHEMQHHKGVPCIGSVFETKYGKFALEVAIIPEKELDNI